MPNSHSHESPTVKPSLGIMRLIEKPSVHILLILIIAFFAYSNTFGVPFVFDDIRHIADNWRIRDLSNVPSLLGGAKGPFASRPLMHVTFALNYYFGGLDTWGYHAVNLAIHLINGILLYLLVLMTGKHLNYEENAVRRAALLASGLFLLHPVQTQAVTYVVSRSMLLATAFYFTGMIFFLRAVTVKEGRSFYIGGLFVASLLGMGSRENFATFPVMLVLYDLFFVSKFRLREAVGRWKIYLPVFLSLGYLAFLVINNTYARSVDYPGVGVSAENYFLTEFSVHWTYLRLLVLPVGQNVDYDYPIANSLLEFPTILSFIGYLGLWAVVIVLARKRPVASFSMLWFLVALFPISFGITLTNLELDDVIFEHRLYLPGAGVIVATASWAVGALERMRVERLRTAALTLVVVVPLVLAVASYNRQAVWASEMSLWTDAVVKSPRKARPHYNLGIVYFEAGQYGKAIEHFEASAEANPDFTLAHYNLGLSYMRAGHNEKAIEHFRTAIELDPNYAEAYSNLGMIYSALPELREKAIEHFNHALRLDPRLTEAHFNLGLIYLEDGLLDIARAKFKTVLRIDPQYPMAAQFLKHISEIDRTERSE